MSVIDWDIYYESCIIMTVESCNNQEIIDRMPFFKFRAMSKKLAKYLEEKNKAENGEGGEGSKYEEMKKETSNMMSNAKSTMGNFKTPSFSKMKFK